jgi:putative Mg2+ transporter-C (MgtC) family protein
MIDQVMDVLLPMLAALVAGSLVGLERGLRSEPAGFRTHALVCAGAAAVIVGAVHAGHALNDVSASSRIAQGLVTGIGFLGAGVIMREGLSVRGLTTSASIWAMAGLGVVFGYRQYLDGFAGTIVFLLILMGLRWFDRHLPRSAQGVLTVRFDAKSALSETQFRALLAELGIHANLMRQQLSDGVVIQSSQIHARRVMPTEALAGRLAAEKSVLGFDLQPLDV